LKAGEQLTGDDKDLMMKHNIQMNELETALEVKEGTKEIAITRAIRSSFPKAKVTNVKITGRTSGEKSCRAKIDGETFYMSSLPQPARSKVYKILNEERPTTGKHKLTKDEIEKIRRVGIETAQDVFDEKFDRAKAEKMINDIIAKGAAKGMTGEDIAGWVQSSFRDEE
jgi:hypothetical protein